MDDVEDGDLPGGHGASYGADHIDRSDGDIYSAATFFSMHSNLDGPVAFFPFQRMKALMSGHQSGAAWILALLIAIVAFGLRSNPDLNRPLEQDELVTLKLYTALDYEALSVEAKSAPLVDLRRLVKGWGKAFTNPWSANNHIVHSLAVTVCQSFLGFGESVARLPALAASVLLAAGLYFLVRAWSQSPFLGSLVALTAAMHPYFLYYGQTARGYSLAALLLVAQIAVVDRNLRRPDWRWHVLSSGLAVASFFNLVTTLMMWLVPLYAVLLIRGPNRRNWALEAVVVFSVVGTFILSHLSGFLHSQAKYGTPLVTLADFSKIDWLDYFAPQWWVLLLLPAFVGVLVGCWRREWLSWATLLALAMTLILILVGRKLPYARTFGVFLIMLFLGLVPLWRSLSGRRLRWICGVVLALPFVGFVVVPTHDRSEPTYSLAMQQIGTQLAGNAGGECVLLPWIWGEESRYYLANRESLFPPSTGSDSGTLFLPCEVVADRVGFRTQYADMAREEHVFWLTPQAWAGFVTWRSGRLRVLTVPVQLSPSAPDVSHGGLAGVVFWQPTDRYFDFASYVADGLKKGTSAWALRQSAISYLSPGMVMVFFASAAESRMALELIEDFQSRSPGRVIWAYRSE